MTTETSANGSTGRKEKGLLTSGKGFLKLLAGLLSVAALASWISLGVGLYLGMGGGVRLTLAIAAAVTTEALFWCIAALLGLTVVEARRSIWRKLTGR